MFGVATGELQSILCVAFGSPEVTYAGTFNGEVYKWKGNRLQTVIGAHSVCACSTLHMGVLYGASAYVYVYITPMSCI